ncbi:hypothetical protein [Wenyingzhuangia aestuarii]|uniref:hypothetical protein n=1 Tax=Wenyingzhuangia aestuarii TaxID=1647582 RepID=UPI00143BD5D7|nr:hypothetical protein [Wenyingzhuangia aestuarii]NJB82478.1 hypothetical protein [Wenyingzhuangia aestuarii]
MKRIKSNNFFILVLSAWLIVSCGSSKKINASNNNDVTIELPCSGYEYETTKGVFRASQSALSTNLSVSREKAMLNAKRTLASLIGSTIKSVTDRYAQDRTIGETSEFSEKFENLTREVVNQQLRGVKKICEVTKQKPDGRYNTFVAIELNTADMFKDLESSISKNEKLRQDYDKKKYEDIFNQEMSKLENEQ